MCSLVLVSCYLSLFLLTVSGTANNFTNARNNRNKRQNVAGCTLPQEPDFGDWEVLNGYKTPGDTIPPNTVVKFRCDVGHKLTSSTPYIICDEHWNLKNIPRCKQLCPAFYSTSTTILTCRDINGDKISCGEVIDGGTLSYECIPYYEVPHRSPKQLFCQDGKWTSNKPLCEPVCGKKVINKLVVPTIGGGKMLKTIEYPWITAIYQKDHGNFVNICGGNIITRRLVLTAAHCVANDYGNALPAENYKIAGAKLYNRYQDPRDASAQYLDIDSIIVHPQYRGESRRYIADIAILTTRELFTLGPLIQPVCFKGVSDIYLHAAYDRGEVAGWGLTEDGLPSEELRFLDIPYKSQTKCEQELPAEFAEKFKFEDKMCAGFHNRNISVCSGDSGSGLVFKNRADDDRYYIHGIVSITPSAGEIGMCNLQQNSLYTKVAYYYSWIEKFIVKYQVEDCLLPAYPENGKYSVESNENKQPGDTVFSNEWLKVTCKKGYLPIISKIICESANFNTLKCQAEEQCTKPNFPQGTAFACTNKRNNFVNCSQATQGITLQYLCPDGYTSIGSTIRSCTGGSWGTPSPQCIPASSELETSTLQTPSIRKISAPQSEVNDNIKVICTYVSASSYKGINPENLDPRLCTHINYAFAGIWDKGEIRVQDDALDLHAGLYRKITELKKKNKNLKVLLSIGGTVATNNSLFSTVASGDRAKIDSFIGSAMNVLNNYGFDGLNIDWHYPEVTDEENYINFLREVKKAFQSKGWLLTASVKYDPEGTGYDAPRMNEILDWVIVRTYDFYDGASSYTGLHTGLYASSKEYIWERNHLNVNASVHLWLNAGLSKNKMVISVALYGRTLTLKDKTQHGIHAPILGQGIGDGIVNYYEICSKYGDWTEMWDDDQKCVYKYNGDQWFSYDTKDAMWIKGAYVKSNGFLGVNVWSIDADDVFGKCGRKFQLLKHLHGGLGHEVDWDVNT